MAISWTNASPFVAGTLVRSAEMNSKLDGIAAALAEVEQTALQLTASASKSEVQSALSAASRAGKVLGFDASGNVVVQDTIGDFLGDWTGSTAYQVRDVVRDANGDISQDSLFYCNTDHTSDAADMSVDTANWTLYIDVSEVSTAAAAADSDASDANTARVAAQASATAAAASAAALTYYDVSFYAPYVGLSSMTIGEFAVARSMDLPAGLTGSQFSNDTNPSTAARFYIYKNGASQGYAECSTGGVWTTSFVSQVNFVAGDILKVDTTASGYGIDQVSISLQGTVS